MEWKEFHGIEVQIPAGTHAEVQESVLPGPGGQGGSPTGERPTLTLFMAGANHFHLQIIKSSEPTSLDGMERVIRGNHMGTNLVGKQTAHGWELSYNAIAEGETTPGKPVHTIFNDIAGGHFECTYGEANCADPAVADAICRSIRVKAP